MKAIEIGKLYSCKVPGIKGVFDVVVLERLKYKGFLVEAVNYSDEQEKILKKKKYKLLVNISSLNEKIEVINIEIGKIYLCELPEFDKLIEVEILEKADNINYLVRVIRCTMEQRKILLKNYPSRFIVNENQLLDESVNFALIFYPEGENKVKEFGDEIFEIRKEDMPDDLKPKRWLLFNMIYLIVRM